MLPKWLCLIYLDIGLLIMKAFTYLCMSFSTTYSLLWLKEFKSFVAWYLYQYQDDKYCFNLTRCQEFIDQNIEFTAIITNNNFTKIFIWKSLLTQLYPPHSQNGNNLKCWNKILFKDLVAIASEEFRWQASCLLIITYFVSQTAKWIFWKMIVILWFSQF